MQRQQTTLYAGDDLIHTAPEHDQFGRPILVRTPLYGTIALGELRDLDEQFDEQIDWDSVGGI